MPIRFRRTLKIAPGIRLNVSKGGVSTSIGRKGSTVNYSKRGVKQTVGIPGTGISYSTSTSKKSKSNRKSGCGSSAILLLIPIILIFSTRKLII